MAVRSPNSFFNGVSRVDMALFCQECGSGFAFWPRGAVIFPTYNTYPYWNLPYLNLKEPSWHRTATSVARARVLAITSRTPCARPAAAGTQISNASVPSYWGQPSARTSVHPALRPERSLASSLFFRVVTCLELPYGAFDLRPPWGFL